MIIKNVYEEYLQKYIMKNYYYCYYCYYYCYLMYMKKDVDDGSMCMDDIVKKIYVKMRELIKELWSLSYYCVGNGNEFGDWMVNAR